MATTGDYTSLPHVVSRLSAIGETTQDRRTARVSDFTHWIDGIGPATRLEIQVPQPAITHTVTVQQLERWANGSAVNPDERIRKDQLKATLAGTAE